MSKKNKHDRHANIDFSENAKGFIYCILISDPLTWETQLIKIGSTQNPVLRLADHFYQGFPGKLLDLHRVSECHDYLHCEVEIKKLLNKGEILPYSQKLIKNIDNIIDLYLAMDLDPNTLTWLIDVKPLRKYFNGKN